MAFFGFSKVPKNQQFEYRPRFWNPEKEEREERLKRYENMGSNDKEVIKSRIAAGFRKRSYGNTGAYRRQQVLRSNVLLFAIILGMLLMTFLLLTNYLPRMVNFFQSGGH